MPSENIPRVEGDLARWFTHFAAVAESNASELGLTSEQAEQMTALATLFQAKRYAVVVARNQERSAVADKNEVLEQTHALIGGYAKAILANPNVSNPLKSALGMTSAPSVKTALRTPTDLVATPDPSGTNKLTWNRGGNSRSVTYVIYARIGLSPIWTIIGQTQRVSFSDHGRVPGQMITYRVIAERGRMSSLPSNEAIVYSLSVAEPGLVKRAA